MSKYNSDISPLIKNYAELLVGVGNSNLNKVLNPVIQNYSQNSTALSEFELIDTAIKNLDKKLIIFIDDLDRLYKEEIIQVVKLIRNSANFGNTVFVVAYDRNYVTNAIKEINSYNPEFFLEKIFQLEIHLPNFDNQIIQKRIYDLLSPRVNASDKAKLLDILLNKKRSFGTNIFNSGRLTTLRDATRFSNSFLVAYSYLEGEIVLSDLLNLEVLRLKYPGVYKLIFFHSEEYLETVTNSNKTHYSLRMEKDESGKNTDTALIHQYLVNHHEKAGIPMSDTDKAINILTSLFPSSDNLFFDEDIQLLSVSNPSSFERYSHYRLLDSNLSEVEFSRYRRKSLKEFCEKINYWVNQGLRWELKRRFESINTYSDKEDFNKVIEAIMFFSRIPSVKTIENDYSGFDFDNLYRKLNNVNEYLKANYYSDKDEYKSFVLDLFKKAPLPYLFDIDFIYSYFNKHTLSDDFIVSKDDFKPIRLKYLKDYLESAHNFDSTVWSLYHCNDLVEAIPQGGGSFQIHTNKNPEATSLVIEFIKEKALDDFILQIIDKEPFDKELFRVSNIIPKMFENFKAFGDFLEDFKEEDFKYLKEFKDFYSKLMKVDSGRYIIYKFSSIPVKKKE